MWAMKITTNAPCQDLGSHLTVQVGGHKVTMRTFFHRVCGEDDDTVLLQLVDQLPDSAAVDCHEGAG